MPQRIHNGRFLFRRAFRLPGIFGFRLIVVFSLSNTILLLDLSDIEGGYLQASLLQHALFDLGVCGIGFP